MSPDVRAFEEALAALAGAPFGVATSSGTLALELALEAAGVGSGHEVIVPGLSAFGTLAAILRRGATPVVVDVEEGGLTLDANAVAQALTDHTRAVIPVHAMGHAPDVAAIRAAAPELFCLEDMAQGFPGPLEGHAAALSLSAGKAVDLGEGGAMLTGDRELARRFRQLTCLGHGGVGAEAGSLDGGAGHLLVGTSARMSGIVAAAGVELLEALETHMDSWWFHWERLRSEVTSSGLEVLPRPRVPLALCCLAPVGASPFVHARRRPPGLYPSHREPSVHGRVRMTPLLYAEEVLERLVVLSIVR